MTEFNWADWTLIVIIVLSSLMSLRRGFIKEAISLATWVVAFVVARSFHPNVQTLLADSVEGDVLRTIAAFGTLFIGTLLVGAGINFLIGALVKLTGLSPLDRLLGMVFGLARGVILSLVVIAVVRLTPFKDSDWWKNSFMIEHLSVVEQWSRNVLEQGAPDVKLPEVKLDLNQG
jgi:membrane protein required for colicin V production